MVAAFLTLASLIGVIGGIASLFKARPDVSHQDRTYIASAHTSQPELRLYTWMNTFPTGVVVRGLRVDPGETVEIDEVQMLELFQYAQAADVSTSFVEGVKRRAIAPLLDPGKDYGPSGLEWGRPIDRSTSSPADRSPWP